MNITLAIIVAISLSMDAFSLSMSIGMNNYSRKKELGLSLITGLFHFFMPIFGVIFSILFKNIVNFNMDLLSGVIFLYIGYEMIKDYNTENDKILKLTVPDMIIFAFGVSLDSFGVGITFLLNIKYILISSLIFSLFSFIFTFIGLLIGNSFSKILGKQAKIVGSLIMFVLSITNIVNFFN